MYITWSGKRVEIYDDNNMQRSMFWINDEADIENAVLQGDHQIVVTTKNVVQVYKRVDDWSFALSSTRWR